MQATPMFQGFGATDVMEGPGAMLRETVFPVGLLPTGAVLRFRTGARLNPSYYILSPLGGQVRLLASVVVGYTESGKLALANTNERYWNDSRGNMFDPDQLDAVGEVEGSPIQAQDLLSADEFSVPVGTRVSVSGGTPFDLTFVPAGYELPGPIWLPCEGTQVRLANGRCGCPGNQVLLADGLTCGCPPGHAKTDAGICMPEPCPRANQERLPDGSCGCPQTAGWFTMPDGTCVAGGCPTGYAAEGSRCVVQTTAVPPPSAEEEPWYKKTGVWLAVGGGVVVIGALLWLGLRKPPTLEQRR